MKVSSNTVSSPKIASRKVASRSLFPFLRTARARLTLWNMLVLAIIQLALGGTVRVTVGYNLLAAVDANLAFRARGHRDFWAFTHQIRRRDRRPQSPPPLRLPAVGTVGRVRWAQSPPPSWPLGGSKIPSQWQPRMVEALYDLHGNRLYPFGAGAPLDQHAFTLAATGREVHTTIRIADEPVRVFSAPLRSGGRIEGVVQIGYALDNMEQTLGHLDRTLLTMIPIAMLATGIGGLFLTGRMLRPVREVTKAAGRIGVEDLSRRLPVSGHDEFSELATTFNGMLARLEQAFEQQRRFTADASHELRTPLAVIKANTSLALSDIEWTDQHRDVIAAVDRAAGVMNHIVQDLLLLARSDAGEMQLRLDPTPLAAVLQTAVAYVQPQSEVTIRNLTEESALAVQGEAGHLTRLFVNLLDNAVRHTPATGSVLLSAYREGPAIIVTVEDTGIGIAPEHLPHVCERFYRVDAARSRAHGGTGLGLAICQSIVRAHGGSLDLTSSPGVGTTVRVTLLHAAAEEMPMEILQ